MDHKGPESPPQAPLVKDVVGQAGFGTFQGKICVSLEFEALLLGIGAARDGDKCQPSWFQDPMNLSNCQQDLILIRMVDHLGGKHPIQAVFLEGKRLPGIGLDQNSPEIKLLKPFFGKGQP